MVRKKRTAATRARRSRRKRRAPDPALQLTKILIGMLLLVVLVLAAGGLVHRMMYRPEPARVPAAAGPPVSRPIPAYEIFPADEPPAAPEVEPDLSPDRQPRVALIIDDMGHDRAMANRFMSLGVPLSVAVLPYSPFGREIARQARSRDLDVMVHLPMEPDEYPAVNPGPGALLTSMNPDELLLRLNENLNVIPEAAGVNNHMGSRLTADSDRMHQVFTVLKKRGLFFIDSRTSRHTRSRQAAALLKVPWAQRDIFLDHDQQPESIRRQLRQLVQRAQRRGQAVGIGHPHAATLQVLIQELPGMAGEVTFVKASRIVRQEG